MNAANKLGLGLVCGLFWGISNTAFALELKQNFYLSGGLGVSQYDLSTFEDSSDGESGVTYEDEAEDVAFSLIAGWNFIDQFSVEVMYYDFGAWEATTSEFDSLSDALEYKSVYEGQITGFGVAARYDVAISSDFDAYVRLGFLSWEMDLDDIDTDYDAMMVDKDTIAFDGTDLMVSFGMKYALSDRLFLYGEFTALDSTLEKNFGDGDKLEEDLPVRAVMGGVQYYLSAPTRKRFDGSAAKKGEREVRDITACDPKYKDIGGILCQE